MRLGLLALLLCFVAGRVVPAAAADRLTLYYYDRPPYSVTSPSGEVSGLVIAPTRAAFGQAGVPIQFVRTSITRILDLVRSDAAPVCSPGWYWTEDRAKFAKYTRPIFRDTPLIGLAAKGFHVPSGIRVADLLAGRTLLTVTDGLSYGPYVDGLIARKDPGQLIHLPHGGRQMIEMVLNGHTELALTSPEDALSYASLGIGGPDYPIIHFPDLAVGDARHIICSKSVPDALIDRLNQGIGTV